MVFQLTLESEVSFGEKKIFFDPTAGTTVATPSHPLK